MIGSVAVVDSAGMGDFVKVQDAIDAQNNLSRKSIYVMRGSYDDPVTSAFKGMQLWGDGPMSRITNINSTGDEAITVDADSCTVRDLAVLTESGGAGSSAILLDGDGNALKRVVVMDSDDGGIVVSSGEANNRLSGVVINDSDGHPFSIDGPNTIVSGSVVFSSGVSGLVFQDEGDQSVAVSNWIDGGGDGIFVNVLAENLLIVGNSTDEAITDRSGTSTVASNEEF